MNPDVRAAAFLTRSVGDGFDGGEGGRGWHAARWTVSLLAMHSLAWSCVRPARLRRDAHGARACRCAGMGRAGAASQAGHRSRADGGGPMGANHGLRGSMVGGLDAHRQLCLPSGHHLGVARHRHRESAAHAGAAGAEQDGGGGSGGGGGGWAGHAQAGH
eukprot:354208-Chlamydomonas_euryale.AAC.2